MGKIALEVRAGSAQLIVSIGIDTLAFAAQQFYNEQAFQESEGKRHRADFFVADPAAFAQSIVRWLDHEREDGSSPLRDMLDAAFKHASDHGADGIEDGQPPPLDASPDGADAFAYAALRFPR